MKKVFLSTVLCFGICGFGGVVILTSCGFGANTGSTFDSLTDTNADPSEEDETDSSSSALSHERCAEHKTCLKTCQTIYHQVHAQLYCEVLTVGEVSRLQKLFKALTTLDPAGQAKLLSQIPAGAWDLYLQAGVSGLTGHVSALLDFSPHSQKNYQNILKQLTSEKDLTLILKDNDPHHEVLKQFLMGAVYPPSLRQHVLTQSPRRAGGEETPAPFCQPLSALSACTNREEGPWHLCGCRSGDLYLHKGVLSYKLSTVENPKTLSFISPENQDLLVALSFTVPSVAGDFVPSSARDFVPPSARDFVPPSAGGLAAENQNPQAQSAAQPFNLFLFTSADPARFSAFELAHQMLEEACGGGGQSPLQTGGQSPLQKAESPAEGTQSLAEGAGPRAERAGRHSYFMKQQQCIAGFYCWLKGLKSSPLHQLLNSPQVESLFSREALSLIRGKNINNPSDDCKGF